jgi:MFS family permease
VADWRWTFYISLIVNAIAFVLIMICYWPPDFIGLHPEGKSRRQQVAELDFIGIILFAGGLTIFLIGIGFGGNPYRWTSATVLCPLILGGLCVFLAFPLWEVYSPDTTAKICPPHLFRNVRTVVVPYGVTFVAGMALISLGTLWPQQIARLFTTDPSIVGWYALANQGSATGMSADCISCRTLT